MTTPFPTYREDYDFSTTDPEITMEQALALSTHGVHRPILTTEAGNDTQAVQTPTPPVVDLSDGELQRDLELALETSDEKEDEDEKMEGEKMEDEKMEDEKMEDKVSDFDVGESDDETNDEPSILHACRHCPEDDRNCYSLVENLHTHIRLDHDLDLIACPSCPEDSFESDEHRENHMIVFHGWISCPQCGMSLKKRSLKKHLDKSCNPAAGSMVSCPKCGKVMKTINLRSHRKNPNACRPGNTPKLEAKPPKRRCRRSSTTRQTSSAIRKKRASSAFQAKRVQFLVKLATDPASLRAEQERLFQQSSSALSPSGSPGGIDGIARFSVRPRVGSTSPSPADGDQSSPILSATA